MDAADDVSEGQIAVGNGETDDATGAGAQMKAVVRLEVYPKIFREVNMMHSIKSHFFTLIVILFFLTSCSQAATSPAAELTNTPAVDTPLGETATEMASTETPDPTNTPVPAKPTRSSDAAVDMADALPSPTAKPTAAATKTPPPTTVATTADGWFIYDSAYYSYTLAYPPEATLQMEGVSGFPTDEQPADLTFEEYMEQLEETYPEDICLLITYEAGFVSVLAPFENGGKYADVCPGMGIGYDAEPISKTVMVNDMPYLAEGYSTLETDDGVWHGEFLDLRLEDGTRLAFGGGFGGQTTREAYAALEQVLLRIVNSFTSSTATTPVGWRSYEDVLSNFTIAYPQTWEILPAYREGQTIFSSPETNSQIRIDTWPLSAGQDGLAKVRQDPSRYALTIDPESITPNTTILGQPAFFHFAPSGGYGSVDMAYLLFQVDDRLFNIFYHSGALPTYKAELSIFRQMLNSFSHASETAVLPTLPTGWEEGSALRVWREHSAPQETTYQVISGTLTSFNPGELVITDNDGQSYTIGGEATVFAGQNVDTDTFSNIPFLNEAEQFRFIARPLASGWYKSMLTAVMQEGDWLPTMYQSFFDLSYESLPTQFADYFPPNEPLHIWLRGTPAQLAPFLASGGEEAWAADLAAAPQALAFGTVENITTLPLHLEKLYVQTEPCQEDAVAEICLGWQQTFPPVSPTTVITATAAALLPSAEGFLLQEPVNGFIAVQLRKDGQIMDSAGQTLSLADVVPGTEIEATGLPGLAGILEAEKIVVLDK